MKFLLLGNPNNLFKLLMEEKIINFSSKPLKIASFPYVHIVPEDSFWYWQGYFLYIWCTENF